MKRAIFVLLAAAVFGAGVICRPLLSRLVKGAGAKNPNGVYDPAFYERKTAQYAELGETRKIVFLGDSRVEAGEWSELFARDDISNRGISGDTTAGILRRLPSSVPSDGVLCVIQVGVNDLSTGREVEEVVANYEKILAYLRQREARVIVTAVLLVGEPRALLNRKIQECNVALARLAAGNGARWLDFNATLAPEAFLASEYSNDGLHLNGKGYLKIRDTLAPYLEAIGERSDESDKSDRSGGPR